MVRSCVFWIKKNLNAILFHTFWAPYVTTLFMSLLSSLSCIVLKPHPKTSPAPSVKGLKICRFPYMIQLWLVKKTTVGVLSQPHWNCGGFLDSSTLSSEFRRTEMERFPSRENCLPLNGTGGLPNESTVVHH